MIDMLMFQKMYPEDHRNITPNNDDLGDEYLTQEDPPLGDEFFMCLPSTIEGFNMQRKEWGTHHSDHLSCCKAKRFLSAVKLDVESIENVSWNSEAFDYLVIDLNTKELIKAVVTNQIQGEQGTDLVRGKGNGLFILLHGYECLGS